METALKNLWMEFMVNGFCGLCGNTGQMPTIRTESSAGVPNVLPKGAFCICPNGRILKKSANLTKHA